MDKKRNAPAGSEFWQVIFPMILGVIFVGFLAVWVVLEVSPGNISRFAEISTVLLVIPYMAASLLGLALLVGLIALTIKIIQILPSWTGKVLEILDRIKSVFKKISKYAVAPVIQPAGFLAGLTGIFKKNDSKLTIE